MAAGRRRLPAGQGRGRDSGSGGRRVQESPDLRPRSYPSFARPSFLHIAPPIECRNALRPPSIVSEVTPASPPHRIFEPDEKRPPARDESRGGRRGCGWWKWRWRGCLWAWVWCGRGVPVGVGCLAGVGCLVGVHSGQSNSALIAAIDGRGRATLTSQPQPNKIMNVRTEKKGE
jgi:hypothetical protein